MTPPVVVDHEVERAVIGAVLVDPSRFGDVPDLLPGVFGNPAHRSVWKAIREVHAARMAIDIVTVGAKLATESDAAALTACADAGQLDSPIRDHAAILVELHQRRVLVAAATNLMRAATDRGAAWRDVKDQAERLVARTLRDMTEAPEAEPFWKSVADALRELQAEAEGGKEPGIPWGLPRLDRLTQGLHRGELTVLAGKTGRGKSALAWQVAESAAAAGYGVLGFTLEMESKIIARRRMAAFLERDSNALRGELGAMGNAMLAYGQRAAQYELATHDDSELTVTELRSRARVHQAQNPNLALVVVDYLQLLDPPPGRYASREREVSVISKSLKALAKELGVAVLALSQFNRDADKEDRPPRLSDLRESGALEQDSGLVVLLHAAGDPVDGLEPYQLLVRKNRHGPRGDVDALFQPRWTSFAEWTPPPPAPKEPKPAPAPRGRGRPRIHPVREVPPPPPELPLEEPDAREKLSEEERT